MTYSVLNILFNILNLPETQWTTNFMVHWAHESAILAELESGAEAAQDKHSYHSGYDTKVFTRVTLHKLLRMWLDLTCHWTPVSHGYLQTHNILHHYHIWSDFVILCFLSYIIYCLNIFKYISNAKAIGTWQNHLYDSMTRMNNEMICCWIRYLLWLYMTFLSPLGIPTAKKKKKCHETDY